MGKFDQDKEKEKKNITAVSGDTSSKWDSVYSFVLVFEQMPERMPSENEICRALSRRLGHIELSTKSVPDRLKGRDIYVWDLWEHLAYSEIDQKKYPPQLAMAGPSILKKDQWDDRMIQQLWYCGKEKQQFADRCCYSILCSNMTSAPLTRQHQCRIIADYADAMLEAFPDCIGIYWPYSQNIVPREYFQEQHWKDPALHFLDGGVNFRMFRVSDEELIFDTFGFPAIGLPDLQLHCKGLEPDEVVLYLRNVASYLYTKGDIIPDGGLIEGMNDEKWVCRREEAIVEPNRVVLDICPGEYAGGRRE